MAEHRSQGLDAADTFVGGFLLLIAIFVFWPVIDRFFLKPWIFLRTIELAPLPHLWHLIPQVLHYPWKADDPLRDSLTNRIYSNYVYICLGASAYGLYRVVKTRSRYSMSMQDVLDGLYGRFQKWLKYIYNPKGQKFIKQDFYKGIAPNEYANKYSGELAQKLRDQIGPVLRFSLDNKVIFQDKIAELVVKECLKRLPETKPLRDPTGPTVRQIAWAEALQCHAHERTLALGLLQRTKTRGVVSINQFLWLRVYASQAAATGNFEPFILWRCIASFSQITENPGNGACSFSEGAGLLSHYFYEVQLTRYQEKLGVSDETLHELKLQPYEKGALKGFDEVMTHAKDTF